ATNNAALVFLRDQAEDLRKKLETSERALQEYRARYNLVSLDDSQNIVVDRLKALNASATAARVRRSEIEVRLQQAEAAVKRHEAPAELASLADSPALAEVQHRIDDLKARRAVLAERYGRRHPTMQETERTLAALEKLRDNQVDTAVANLRTQRDKAVAEEKELAGQLAAAEADSLKLDQIGVEYNVLKRAIETQKTIYSQVLSQLNEASIAAQIESVNVRIADRATPNPVPVSPNLRKTTLLLTFLAIAIIGVYPFCVELLFARVRSGSDVEYYLGTTLLGEIGAVRRVNEADRPHLVERAAENPAAEQFRALFSQLQLVSRIDPPKAILITSTVPGEGKSFIASNLASAFVAHGRRVLLIDADLRRPSQHRSYKLDNKAGVLRWIEEGGDVAADPCNDPRLGIVEVTKNLFLLRTGGNTRRASEIVATGKLTPLITALQREFDILIFDTPPAGVFPDAISFSTFCHELVFICRFGIASRQQVRGLLERWRQTGLDLPGIVLNALPSGRTSGYYYYHGYGASSRYAKYYSGAKQ
ncbi:MAG TPA: polysaccharide biosynthesis tyrosine autokinase, partial [Opitutus sp.]|nr:polysaccharide biosynthesis tyrosine autokinase [Opitutus sp.]